MGISFNQDTIRNSAGVKWEIIGKFNLDASYPTGGYSVLPNSFGLTQIESMLIYDAVFGYEYKFNSSTQKLQVYGGGGTFSGTPLPLHNHEPQVINLTVSSKTIRIYFTAAVGTFQVAEVITGGTSGNTATVSAVDMSNQFLTLTAPTGNFSNAETITGGTSAATATTIGTLNDNWDVSSTYASSSILSALATNTGVGLTQVPPTTKIITNYYRYHHLATPTSIDTLRADGWTSLSMIGLDPFTTDTSAGTPSGTITGVQGEVLNGTNLASVINVEFNAIGL